MLEGGCNKGVCVEISAHLLEVAFHGVLAGAIEAEARVSREGELLLCVGIEHAVQADDALLPLADDADEVVDGDGAAWMIQVEDGAVVFSWRDNASGLLSPYRSALIPLSLMILIPSS